MRFLAAKKGSKASVPGSSCKDILTSGEAQGNGGYWIDPTDSGDPFKVFCDMNSYGGKQFFTPFFWFVSLFVDKRRQKKTQSIKIEVLITY